MAYFRTKTRDGVKSQDKIMISGIAEKNPEQLIGIKTSRVYSQIARVGRAPNQQKKQYMLISALEDARVKIEVDGHTIKKDPKYVPMSAATIEFCFGNRIDKMPKAFYEYKPNSDSWLSTFPIVQNSEMVRNIGRSGALRPLKTEKAVRYDHLKRTKF